MPLSSDLDDPPSISPKTLAKQLNIGNSVQLEKRIKRELEEQGRHQYLFSLQIVFDKKTKKKICLVFTKAKWQFIICLAFLNNTSKVLY